MADRLRYWAIRLQCWAYRLDPDESRAGPLVAAHEDAERALASMDAAMARVALVPHAHPFEYWPRATSAPDPAKRPPGLPPRLMKLDLRNVHVGVSGATVLIDGLVGDLYYEGLVADFTLAADGRQMTVEIVVALVASSAVPVEITIEGAPRP